METNQETEFYLKAEKLLGTMHTTDERKNEQVSVFRIKMGKLSCKDIKLKAQAPLL